MWQWPHSLPSPESPWRSGPSPSWKATPLSPEASPTSSPWRVAVHEAGHAVFARALGLAVLSVSVGPEPAFEVDGQVIATSFGRCLVRSPFTDATKARNL